MTVNSNLVRCKLLVISKPKSTDGVLEIYVARYPNGIATTN